jgi:hypothetical protein
VETPDLIELTVTLLPNVVSIYVVRSFEAHPGCIKVVYPTGIMEQIETPNLLQARFVPFFPE